MFLIILSMKENPVTTSELRGRLIPEVALGLENPDTGAVRIVADALASVGLVDWKTPRLVAEAQAEGLL